jgi:hypothetical protein
VPGVVTHDHLYQHITREELALGGLLLAVLDLDHLFHRHQDATELVLHASPVDALDDVALDRLLHAGVGVHHVPAQVRVGGRRQRSGLGSGSFYSVGHYFLHPRIRS